MKLYRIKRISDGKYLKCRSHVNNMTYKNPEGRIIHFEPVFDMTGAFFKQRRTIEDHLCNLCHDFIFNGNTCLTRKFKGPFYDRLKDYQVECLEILDSETVKISAEDFMNIKARAYG